MFVVAMARMKLTAIDMGCVGHHIGLAELDIWDCGKL